MLVDNLEECKQKRKLKAEDFVIKDTSTGATLEFYTLDEFLDEDFDKIAKRRKKEKGK